MTARKIPDIIKQTARDLRKNMTEAEHILWSELRRELLWWHKFLRQYPIYVYTQNSGMDRFIIPDFVCKKSKIIIEIDGNIHDLDHIYHLDLHKQNLLELQWYKIIRFSNNEILHDLSNTLMKIKNSL